MFSHKKNIFAYITYVTKYTNLKKEKMKKKSIKGLAAATAVIMCLAITSCEIYSAVKSGYNFLSMRGTQKRWQYCIWTYRRNEVF